jgi:predicted transcriptional regulator
MSLNHIVKTWKWRISKSGLRVKDFAGLIGIKPAILSHYLHGRTNPSLKRFDEIEGKLRELGV